jgi:hypothetical protein
MSDGGYHVSVFGATVSIKSHSTPKGLFPICFPISFLGSKTFGLHAYIFDFVVGAQGQQHHRYINYLR